MRFFSAVFLNCEDWGEGGSMDGCWPGKRSGHSLIYITEDIISSIDEEERDGITFVTQLHFLFIISYINQLTKKSKGEPVTWTQKYQDSYTLVHI